MSSLRKAAQDVLNRYDEDDGVIDVHTDFDLMEALREALQAEPEPEPVAYITQAALDALKRGASSSVRVWLNPDEPNGDIALYTKERG